mmetsp:Transcript_11548/g.17151  ORF Transcript_11548/g.17151 Transcript_11548/m.17151 type:complete len:571 (-) Transcript_11548:511-2223(-)
MNDAVRQNDSGDGSLVEENVATFLIPSDDEEKDFFQKSREEEEEQQQQIDEKSKDKIYQNLIVHNAVCNEYKTADGVEAGGDRLAQEIMDVILAEVNKRRELERIKKKQSNDIRNAQDVDNINKDEDEDGVVDVTLSLVGNSLGGIYSRYAIARLIEMNQEKNEKLNLNTEQLTKSNPLATAVNSGAANDQSNVLTPAFVIDGKIRVYYNVFCTTATPHLGISKHTYVPMPRSAEIGVAHALGNTGRDLFRLNDLMKTMATSERFLVPLKLFQKRVAYANAFFTDFPVPAETAAFLNTDSSYPHHFVYDDSVDEDVKKDDINNKGTANIFENEEGQDSIVRKLISGNKRNAGKTFNDFIIATCETFPTASFEDLDKATAISESDNKEEGGNRKNKSRDSSKNLHSDELATMSASLDSLGWKKVFVDIRGEIPIGVSIPSITSLSSAISERLRKKSSNESGTYSQDGDDDLDKSENEHDIDITDTSNRNSPCPVRSLKSNRRVVESRDIAEAISTLPGDNRISLPIGHNMMCAFSRSRLSTLVNRGGRPIMDGLAQELVEDIFVWDDTDGK